MRVTTSGLLLIVLIIIVSVSVANISNLINVNFDNDDSSSLNKKDFKDNNDLIIGESPDHLFWFIQISDIHISIFHDLGRITDLEEFCDLTVSAIRPSVVLATGDLTDSKQQDNVGSRQYPGEWKQYRRILDNCKSLKETDTVWLDVRGNHDNFDVPGVNSDRNLYKKYSATGESRSYLEFIRGRNYSGHGGNDVYAFLGVDACPAQGLKRPFNFIGLLSDHHLNHLHNLAANASSKANVTIWFGHYPTSCILAKGAKVRDVIGEGDKSFSYLCGHLHTIEGMVPNMYTIQKQGYLELELGDWKDHRIYRVAAIDHGLFSFVDVIHKDWPVILITNPKHALFTIPNREPLLRMLTSTHIRILVFSVEPIISVEVQIDGGDWEECSKAKSGTVSKGLPQPPLYILKWQPQLYSEGVHYIHVRVLSKDGKERMMEQPFSLDGTRLSFKLFPRLFLMSNLSSMFQMMFGFTVLGCVLPLCALRYFNTQVKLRKKSVPRFGVKCVDLWMKRLWIVANIDRFFYPLTFFPLYLTVGPWSVGELMEGHVGVLFAWGTFINGTYLPGAFTYAYGFLELFMFQCPLIMALGYKLHSRLYSKERGRRHSKGLLNTLFRLLSESTFIMIVSCQLVLSYCFWLAYGSMALILGPFRFWPFIMSVILWRQVYTVPERSIRLAASAWLQENHYEARTET